MPIRKTETRIPTGLAPSDLGEAVVASDGRSALVSFLTSPLTASHQNIYVLFVTDSALAASIESYEWVFAEDGAFPHALQTTIGETPYTPTNIGNMTLMVRYLDNSGAELGSLTFVQDIGPLNPALESMIEAANDSPGPGASNPDVISEMVNSYYSYYQNVTLKTPESGDSFKRYICSFLFDGASKKTPDDRRQVSDRLADALDSNPDAFTAASVEGVGVCGIRLDLLAMTFPAASPLLPWTELPQEANQNALADEQLRQKLAALGDDDKIDLLNIARFPKTNISRCASIIEALRDKYFPGASFDDVLTGMSGTRETWITMHYSKGPLAA